MTRDRWLDDPKAVEAAEAIYAFVGKYVVAFQWLEGKIDEMFLLARGEENRRETFAWLATKTNSAKIDAFRALVTQQGPFRPIAREDWPVQFDAIIERLHAERRRRNGLLHAQYLFDFLAIGAPVLRTDVQRYEGEPHFSQEELSAQRCEEILGEIAQLSFDLGMICVQLRHAYSGEPYP